MSRKGRKSGFCIHSSLCPGCPQGESPYPEQLAWKRGLVKDAFLRAGMEVDVEEIAPAIKREGYRTSSKLPLARGRKGVAVGVYKRSTHSVVDIPRCVVHHPLINRAANALRYTLALAPGMVSQGRGGEGWMRYAVFQVSAAEEALLLTLVTRSGDLDGTLLSLVARLREVVPEISGVVRNINDSEGNEILGEEYKTLWGEGHISETFGEVTLLASTGVFLQANRAEAARVYAAGVELLTPMPEERALDLYCGAGGFAFHLAPKVAEVVGIEVNPRSIKDAEATAEDGGITNSRFYADVVEERLPELIAEGYFAEIVTMNPARKGAEPEAIAALRQMAPRAILYLSCNPETLARDAALLTADGLYKIDLVRPYDFFPHTDHIETLALFTRK
ncbi:MAG: 23S rRNA (uracil(1939)-C(5))-methyltransferase RlmD [Deltaproteobacteria bacterium]|nr:MAG: 23S rRNA (uracil(1939)-C(5))-methyltransferase RlmD [Deltaproteobacteria bacterium]